LGACLLLVACDAGPAGTAPSNVSPLPTTTNGCAALSQTTGAQVGIVNGTACLGGNSSVLLLFMQNDSHANLGYCSGTVIGQRAILTAAHCLNGATLVIAGNDGGERARSNQLKIFPGYPAEPSSLDAAVVLTDKDIGLPAYPVLASRDVVVGEQAVLAGWGEDATGAARVLRAGTATVTAVRDIFIHTKYLGSNSSGVCWGDSGGPLLVSQGGAWTIAGIASLMDGCAMNDTSAFLELRNPAVQSFVFGLVPDIRRQ
jgi:hypothetical protein